MRYRMQLEGLTCTSWLILCVLNKQWKWSNNFIKIIINVLRYNCNILLKKIYKLMQ